MKPKNECNIVLTHAPGEVLIANSMIRKFKEKNDIEFELEICLDYLITDYGVYIPELDEYKKKIYVNPDLSVSLNDVDIKEMKCYEGYINDYSLLANVLHEFAHYLTYEVYSTLIKEYKEEFPQDRLYLCEYSNQNIDEEMAEIIRLYILNPLLLKLLDEKVFNFLKRYFKSPSPLSQKHTVKIFDDFPIEIKRELKEKWNILHDYGINKIIKVGDYGNGHKKRFNIRGE